MSKHMDASLRALCFFYRNPPPGSGVRPQPYKEIAKLIRRPRMPAGTGPAMSLRAQGVNGHDLLNICDAEEFCRDLKVTPFVARKVLSLRGQCAR